MRSYHFVAACFALSLLVGASAHAGELVRLAEWPVAAAADSWPAGQVMPASAAVNVAQASAQETAPPADAWSAVPVPCGTAPCEDDCCFDFNVCCLPCRYFQADALLWHRVGTGCSETVVIDTNTNAPLLNTDDLTFDLAPGMRFLVGWQPDPCHGCQRCCAWELSYFGIFGWNGSDLVTGAGNLAVPGDLGLNTNNFFGADLISTNYESDLHNIELNCVKSCCLCEDTRLDFLTGFRYIFLNDNFLLTATDLQEGTSSYAVNANNNLLGPQLGGRLTHSWCNWAVELTGKAGVFYNFADQHQTVTDFPNNNIIRDATGSGSSVAMLGEMSVMFIRPLDDYWSLRVGYSALGLGGVALAPDQLDFTDTFASGTGFHDSGFIFAHGATVGLQRTW